MAGRARNAFVQFFRERGIQLRFAALGLSATEAIFLKKAIVLSSPLTTFVLWCDAWSCGRPASPSSSCSDGR